MISDFQAFHLLGAFGPRPVDEIQCFIRSLFWYILVPVPRVLFLSNLASLVLAVSRTGKTHPLREVDENGALRDLSPGAEPGSLA